MNYASCIELVEPGLARAEALLTRSAPMLDLGQAHAVRRLVANSGKRLRPTLTLLSGHACRADVEQVICVAAGIELLHTATLIHDDLIDDAPVRRGMPTLNAHLSPKAVVLVGDFLFARSAGLVGESGHPEMVRAFANTLATICRGEMQQLFSQRDPRARLARSQYDRRVLAKTASLFALSSKAGAILADAGQGTIDALHRYGEHLGMAFQIVDDVLDVSGDPDEMGKPVGEDLRHGLITLPTLFFLEAHPDHPDVAAALARRSGGNGGGDASALPDDDVVAAAVAAVRSSEAPERALREADRLARTAREALEGLSPSPYLDAMANLTGFVVDRAS